MAQLRFSSRQLAVIIMKIQFGIKPGRGFSDELDFSAWKAAKAELTADFEIISGTEIAQKYL